MTNSLREEIINLLDGADIYGTKPANYYTDNILQMIEKRIDLLLISEQLLYAQDEKDMIRRQTIRTLEMVKEILK